MYESIHFIGIKYSTQSDCVPDEFKSLYNYDTRFSLQGLSKHQKFPVSLIITIRIGFRFDPQRGANCYHLLQLWASSRLHDNLGLPFLLSFLSASLKWLLVLSLVLSFDEGSHATSGWYVHRTLWPHGLSLRSCLHVQLYPNRTSWNPMPIAANVSSHGNFFKWCLDKHVHPEDVKTSLLRTEDCSRSKHFL